VPAGFVVPRTLETPQFWLEPLSPEHNEADHAAWSTSREHIHATPGWEESGWPDDRSPVDNLRDLQGHSADFENRTGFTYTVLDAETGDVIGCVYIYPGRTGASDAHVQSWVRESRAELDVPVWRAVSNWLASDSPFARVEYAGRVSAA
jgi:hypothetical protein